MRNFYDKYYDTYLSNFLFIIINTEMLNEDKKAIITALAKLIDIKGE